MDLNQALVVKLGAKACAHISCAIIVDKEVEIAGVVAWGRKLKGRALYE